MVKLHNKTQDKRICTKCEKPKSDIYFYVSYSPLHNGKIPVCKSCILEQLDIDNIESVKDTLRMVDRPYLHFLWISSLDEAQEAKKKPFGILMKNLGMKQYRYLTWKDSDFSEKESNLDETNENNHISKRSKFVVTEDVIDKWGDGYIPEEYHNFERKYDRLIKNYGEKTALHTEGLLSYIRFRVKEEMATAKGLVKDAKEWGVMASKAATDAKINVSQLSKSDISGGVDVLAQLFEAVETEIGIIPHLPKVLAQPYDDADLIIWANINYYRRLEDKPKVAYKDIYAFYDEMLEDHFLAKGFNDEQIEKFKSKRNNVFRDLEDVYKEPLYETGDE
jgi:hypothetical protein